MASETLNTKDEILGILKNHKAEFYEKYGITDIGLFGSVVRGENNENSDIDILYEYNPDTHKLTLFKLEDFRLYLESLLGRKVDIANKKRLKPYIGRHILEEVTYI
ncbi:MAG: nucleotidyltransferase family protein [Deltaproteobacteria bacterium]|jgi:predicted nucleotidyltransferase|nr:nucleotidyltransferase family protein [Deltaproteobacteria bacterium]MCL5879814.1 nucleotidyltransferase family protein [Deltaproteobacteria bacterium]MDA8303903.1 nucleotidyltransferase family protein [Deltaproteobacteria bacterium]